MSIPDYAPNFVPDEEWLKKRAGQKKFEAGQKEFGPSYIPPEEEPLPSDVVKVWPDKSGHGRDAVGAPAPKSKAPGGKKSA